MTATAISGLDISKRAASSEESRIARTAGGDHPISRRRAVSVSACPPPSLPGKILRCCIQRPLHGRRIRHDGKSACGVTDGPFDAIVRLEQHTWDRQCYRAEVECGVIGRRREVRQAVAGQHAAPSDQAQLAASRKRAHPTSRGKGARGGQSASQVGAQKPHPDNAPLAAPWRPACLIWRYLTTAPDCGWRGRAASCASWNSWIFT